MTSSPGRITSTADGDRDHDGLADELEPRFHVTAYLDPDDDARDQTETVRRALDDALRALSIPDYTIVELGHG